MAGVIACMCIGVSVDTVNNAAMNLEVHVSLQIRHFVFSRYVTRNEIAGSYGKSIFNF